MHDFRSIPPPFPPEHRRGDTCIHCDRFDPETEAPTGPACGRLATQIIFWKDQRYSTSCGQHGLKALDPDALHLVLCVHPIEPAIEAAS